jgi:hypothetical protein
MGERVRDACIAVCEVFAMKTRDHLTSECGPLQDEGAHEARVEDQAHHVGLRGQHIGLGEEGSEDTSRSLIRTENRAA